ncbi:MAG TPA: hypothetical protein PLA80_13855, partial [Synergistaceae bacterium]|nr:hypothetical protein [Synergistaceae bacterium]
MEGKGVPFFSFAVKGKKYFFGYIEGCEQDFKSNIRLIQNAREKKPPGRKNFSFRGASFISQ